MNALHFLRSAELSELEKVCREAETSIAYFRQIAYGHRFPSRDLALRLERASHGRMRAEYLIFPDRYNGDAA